MKLLARKAFFVSVVMSGMWLSYFVNTEILAPTQYTGVRAEEMYVLPTADPYKVILPTITEVPTSTPAPTSLPKPTAVPVPSSPWGIAQKIGEDTYTIKIQYDSSMASPKDVYNALNDYRNQHSVASLIWDDTLANYAAGRAELFKNIKGTDSHAGFNKYLDSEDGFKALGFGALGENSYYGGPVTGTHVIEWVFAQSPGHNANQLDTKWTHVGIGVSETGINLNFGGNKM